jgi:hypothetical protein
MYNKLDLIFMKSVADLERTKCQALEGLLREAGRLVIFFVQLMGFCPFSLNKSSRLRFQWLSFPTLLVGFHTSVSILFFVSVFLNPVAPSDSDMSSVDRFGTMLWAFSTIGTQSYLRLSGIILHRRTRDVWGKLHSILVKIHQSSSDSTRVYIEEQLKRHELKMRIISLIILGCVAFFVKSMLSLSADPNRPSRPLLNILIGVLWSFHEILSITKSLWFVHVIDLTRIGFAALVAEQEALILRAGSTNKKSTSSVMLRDYESLEEVTQVLSERFAIELGISIFYGSTVVASFIEQICQMLTKGNFTLVLMYMPDLLLHCLEIGLLCDSGTWLIKEVSFATVIANFK